MDQNTKKTTICHLSDLHLPLPGQVPIFHLVNKRALGFANLKFNRGKTHKLEIFEALLANSQKEDVDLTIISGDLTNLALDFEYEQVKNIFDNLGFSQENLMLIPGNHDRYTPLSQWFTTFEHQMKKWLPNNFNLNHSPSYPITRQVGSVAIAAMDTAVWRGPLRAAGKVNTSQLKKVVQFFEYAEVNQLAPLLVLHHAPFALHYKAFKQYLTGLEGFEKIHDALIGRNATVIHGHIHIQSRTKFEDMTVIGVPSASNDTGNPATQAAYHLYTFNDGSLKTAEAVQYWPQKAEKFKKQEIKKKTGPLS